ncbi:MAG: hypothetical protein NXH75_00345 [Halobacteriovoraceae bacterium]|nr:hypothetical protein [Halobacteriovoraceae bacterium]
MQKHNEALQGRLLIAILLFLSCSKGMAQDWLCTQTASIKNENEILSCGVGVAKSESAARVKALKAAQQEFKTLCGMSYDCKGKKILVTPLRNSCKRVSKRKYKCLRGLKIKWEGVKDEFKNSQALTPYLIFHLGYSSSPLGEIPGYIDSASPFGLEFTYIPSRERLNGFQINFSGEYEFFKEDFTANSSNGEVSGSFASFKTNFSFFNDKSYFGPYLGLGHTSLSSVTTSLPQGSDELEFTGQSLILGGQAGWLVPITSSFKGSIKLEAEYHLYNKKRTRTSFYASNPDIKPNLSIGIKFGIPLKLN